MRWLGRLLKRLLAVMLVLVIALAGPVIYVETLCQGDATAAPAAPLSGETRPEVRTLLTYPEWHIVHAYDDYARVIGKDDPHDYRYTAAIGGFWSALCTLTRASAEMGDIDRSTKQMVYVIGLSFSVEMLAKAAYEETLGRLATVLRGGDRAVTDDLSADQAGAYATFLQQTPWYLYDFRADAEALEAAATRAFRDRERVLALGTEHRVRAAYAGVIEGAVAATGGDDATLQMVVAGLPPARLAAEDGVTVLRVLPEGVEIETPRYRTLTRLLDIWAAEGARFVDMAGNDRILFTAISGSPQADGALMSLPRQGANDSRHLFVVTVPDLAETLRGLAARGLTLEHVHDY